MRLWRCPWVECGCNGATAFYGQGPVGVPSPSQVTVSRSNYDFPLTGNRKPALSRLSG